MVILKIGIQKFKEKLFSENEEITLHVRGGCKMHFVNLLQKFRLHVCGLP